MCARKNASNSRENSSNKGYLIFNKDYLFLNKYPFLREKGVVRFFAILLSDYYTYLFIAPDVKYI